MEEEVDDDRQDRRNLVINCCAKEGSSLNSNVFLNRKILDGQYFQSFQWKKEHKLCEYKREREINFHCLSLYVFLDLFVTETCFHYSYKPSFNHRNLTISSYRLLADIFLFLVSHYLTPSSPLNSSMGYMWV